MMEGTGPGNARYTGEEIYDITNGILMRDIGSCLHTAIR